MMNPRAYAFSILTTQPSGTFGTILEKVSASRICNSRNRFCAALNSGERTSTVLSWRPGAFGQQVSALDRAQTSPPPKWRSEVRSQVLDLGPGRAAFVVCNRQNENGVSLRHCRLPRLSAAAEVAIASKASGPA